ncbi:histidine phosphatase family protein [Marinomonas gallaica]|uniref:histidine phosphatase family protein n=1 Tax=Marinomonas gallaica TaxID=1806667 RepID=UPI003C5CB8AA
MQLIKKPFVFARHAQSSDNAAGKIGGSTDSPLSNLGVLQAKAARPYLDRPWSAIYTSDLMRTIQTAELASPRHTLTQMTELRERHWGVFEGQPIMDDMNYFETPPEGEPWSDFLERTVNAVNTILLAHEAPLIIAHSGIYRALQHVISGSPYGPRIGNADPVLITPNTNTSHGWDIIPFKGQLL